MYLLCSFLVAAGLALAADDLRIHTIAGDGELAGPVAGAVAEGSSVGSGWAIAFDSQNRLYISTIKGEVWRINLEGRWESLWKSKTGALLFGLTVDSQERVFVSDFLSHQVYRIDPDGTASVVAGNGQQGTRGDGGTSTEASLDSPIGLATDDAGNLFISESGRIRVVNAEGLISTYAAGTSSGSLSIDRDGNLYLTDFVRGAVQKITPDRTVADVAKGSPLSVSVCPDGRAYFTEFYQVRRIIADGTELIAGSSDRVFAVDDGLASDARFVTPLALACDGLGRLVVYDASAARLRQIELSADSSR